jgi:3-hydroxyacyl-CoA dehydrogenase
MDVKKAVFAELDAVARPDAVLASNTSYLDIDEIAAETSDPTRVIGLHFFSPAHVMKLLEVIVTRHATPEVLATGLALGKRSAQDRRSRPRLRRLHRQPHHVPLPAGGRLHAGGRRAPA